MQQAHQAAQYKGLATDSASDDVARQAEEEMMMQQTALQGQFGELPENCSNARYLDIQAKKLMGSGSFGKSLAVALLKKQEGPILTALFNF